MMHQGIYPVYLLAQDAAPTPEVEKSLLNYIASGGEVGYLIILLSLVAVTMIVAQLISLRRARVAPPDQAEVLERLIAGGDVRGAVGFCENPDQDSPLTRTVGAALVRCARSPFGFLEMRSAVEEIGREQVARLHRTTEGIGLVASIAPMLGLLGTVVGMVGAFDTISLTEGPVRPDALAGDISVALVTTVLGLIVAIPCTAAYTYLRGRIDQIAVDLSETIERIIAPLETGRRTAPAPAQPQGSPQAAGGPPNPGDRRAS